MTTFATMKTREHSNLIQLYVSEDTVWIPNNMTTGNVEVKVKLSSQIFEHLKTIKQKFTFSACIENETTGKVFSRDTDNNELFRFGDLQSSVVTTHSSYCRRSFLLRATIPIKLFRPGDSFRIKLEVRASESLTSNVLVGFSTIIRVAHWILEVSNIFNDNPKIVHMKRNATAKENVFARDKGPRRHPFEVNICLRDLNNNIVKPEVPVYLDGDLIYSNGSYPPKEPFAGKKNKKLLFERVNISSPLLLTKLQPTQKLHFLIHEVSKNHPYPFQVKVFSSKGVNEIVVHDGKLDCEIIISTKPLFERSSISPKKRSLTSNSPDQDGTQLKVANTMMMVPFVSPVMDSWSDDGSKSRRLAFEEVSKTFVTHDFMEI